MVEISVCEDLPLYSSAMCVQLSEYDGEEQMVHYAGHLRKVP